MKRYVLAAFALAVPSCGLVGSTVGYAGSFCGGNFASQAIFCNSFDFTDAEDDWTIVPDGGGVTLEIARGPQNPATSPPNVLHIVRVDASHAEYAHIAKGPMFPVPSITCTFELNVLAAGVGMNNLIASVYILGDAGQSQAMGIMVSNQGGDAGIAASLGTCQGLSCLHVGTQMHHIMLDGGEWQALGFTVSQTGVVDGGYSFSIQSLEGDDASVVVTTQQQSYVVSVGLTQGIEPNADASDPSFEAFVDNVRCTSP